MAYGLSRDCSQFADNSVSDHIPECHHLNNEFAKITSHWIEGHHNPGCLFSLCLGVNKQSKYCVTIIGIGPLPLYLCSRLFVDLV